MLVDPHNESPRESPNTGYASQYERASDGSRVSHHMASEQCTADMDQQFYMENLKIYHRRQRLNPRCMADLFSFVVKARCLLASPETLDESDLATLVKEADSLLASAKGCKEVDGDGMVMR